MSNIAERLTNLFEKHRLVFWYDGSQEFRADYESLDLGDIEKKVVDGNEFGIKIQVLRRQHQQKFLLYFPSECPEPRDNWLVDLLLSNCELRTNPVELLLQDLGIGREYASLIEQHFDFFKSQDRCLKFKNHLQAEDTEAKLCLNMLAVLCGTAPQLESILFKLFNTLDSEFTAVQSSMIPESIPGEIGRRAKKFGLEEFFWSTLEREFSYHSDAPSLTDFLISLFRTDFNLFEEQTALQPAATRTFLNHWKDSHQYREIYRSLADRIASESYLNIQHELYKQPSIEGLLISDTFRELDQRILSEIKEQLLSSEVLCEPLQNWIDKRKNSHWRDCFENEYNAMQQAIKLIDALKMVELKLNGVDDGLRKYRETYFQLDLYYRKFCAAIDASGRTELFATLKPQIEKLYINHFLITLADNWQEQIEQHGWNSGYLASQRSFHENKIMPFVQRQSKIFVIISDALRYECAAELKDMLTGENRYQVELDAMLGVIPSYTQLGMAALLPHTTLEMDAEGEKVFADGQLTQGLDYRLKILKTKHGDRATAMHLKEFMQLNMETGRELTRQHDVIYLYHDYIDHIGDDPNTENLTFQAVSEAQETLVKACKKISAFNGNNILITSDHGFLYQSQSLQENDLISVQIEWNGPHKHARRFISSQGCQTMPELWHQTAKELNLEGDLDLQFPRGTHRLKKSGAGMHFVHGGTSLQEVVIPCLSVKKIRTDDVTQVDVSIINPQSTITTNQVTIAFYQEEVVGEKVRPRTVKAGFYRKTGELISDTFEMTFSSSQKETVLREKKQTFVFLRNLENRLECVLKLTNKVGNTQQFSAYKEFNYLLSKTFEGDFDL